MNKFEVSDIYEASWKEHGRSVHALNWSNAELADLRRRVLLEGLDHVKGPPTLSVLDVGCGFGDLLNIPGIARWMNSYTGIDFRPEFIEVAKSRFHTENAKFVIGDIMTTPVVGHDVVLANGTLAFYGMNDIFDIVAEMWAKTNVMLAFNFTRNTDIGLGQINTLLQYIGCDRYVIRRDYGTLGEFAIYCYEDTDDAGH